MSTLDDLLNEVPGPREKEAADHDEIGRLHKEWVNSGKHPDKLQPLLKKFEPLIDQRTRQLAGGADKVNQDAVRLRITQTTVQALDTYDPSRGASPKTWVYGQSRAALRDVIKSQNMARIPENKALRIGDIQRAESALGEEYGGVPPVELVAREVGMSTNQVKKLKKQMVKDLSSDGFEASVLQTSSPRDREILPIVRNRLNPQEQRVFDAIYAPGNGGKPPRTKDIARKLGMSESDVARAKTGIIRHYEDLK